MKVGTPENPEIIEPGQSQPMNARVPGRMARAWQIVKWMITTALPAAGLDWICWRLLELGRHEDSGIAWLLLLLFALPALFTTLVTLVIELVLSFVLLATLSGRAVNIATMPMGRFVRFGSPGDRFSRK